MKLSQIPRTTPAERLALLERRADAHDQVLKPMAEQVGEMYGLLTKWRNINWFVVKLTAGAGGLLGFAAIVLTIADKAARLSGHSN